jgi:hypothetical protein
MNNTHEVEPATVAGLEDYSAPQVETVMTEETLAREVKYAGDGTLQPS